MKYDEQTDKWERLMRASIKLIGISQAEVAQKMKMHRSCLTRRLNNIDNMSLGELRLFADITGLEISIKLKGE